MAQSDEILIPDAVAALEGLFYDVMTVDDSRVTPDFLYGFSMALTTALTWNGAITPDDGPAAYEVLKRQVTAAADNARKKLNNKRIINISTRRLN